jgi:hypothetical protein
MESREPLQHHGRRRVQRSPLAEQLIPSVVSRRTKRIVLFLLGVWFGGVLMVGVAAPAGFWAVDSVMASPPTLAAPVIKGAGPVAVRELLHYQIGEASRALFVIWGWVQIVLAGLVLLLLLFLSTSGKIEVGLSAAMAILALLANFVFIPRLTEVTRGSGAAKGSSAGATFQLLHGGFTAFELTTVVLGAMLLFLLFRPTSVAGGGGGDLGGN